MPRNGKKGNGRKQHTDETKELARARVAAGESLSRVARELGIAKSTLHTWLTQADRDGHQESREKRKEKFIDKAWDVIDQALDLSSQKIRLATVSAERFEPLLQQLIELLQKREDVDAGQVRDIIKAVSQVMNIGLTEISTFTGTIYDKQAKANGEEDAKFVFEIRGEGDYKVLAEALEGLSDGAKREVLDNIKRLRGEAAQIQH
jgi:transposase-like protein